MKIIKTYKFLSKSVNIRINKSGTIQTTKVVNYTYYNTKFSFSIVVNLNKKVKYIYLTSTQRYITIYP